MATVRNNTPLGVTATGLRVERPPHPALTSEGLYGLTVIGGCMVPLIGDGDAVVCDPSAPYSVGDIVVIFHRTASGEVAGACKRLALGIDRGITFPFHDDPRSNVMPLVVFECLVPARRYTVRCSAVLGIHKVVGKRDADGQVDASLVAANRRHWQAKQRTAQKQIRALKTIGAVA